MKIVLFIEVVNEDVLAHCQGDDVTIISLLPEVSAWLMNKKISFSIPADYLALSDFHAVAPSYTSLFSLWLQNIDRDLLPSLDGLRAANIGPARLYAYYLNLLVDPIVSCSFWMKQMWTKLSPDKVIFFAAKVNEIPVDFQLYQKDQSAVSLVLPVFCEKYGTAFHTIKYNKRASWVEQGKERVRLAYFEFKKLYRECRQTLKQLKNSRNTRPRMLRLHGGWGLEDLEGAARRRGYNVIYRLKKLSIHKLHPQQDFLRNYSIDLGVLSDFVALDLTSLLSVRLRYFIEVICPRLDLETFHYAKLLRKHSVKIVVSPYKIDFSDFPLFAAASGAADTTAVQILHGWGLFDNPIHVFTEWPCNLLLTYDNEINRHFSQMLKPIGTQVSAAQLWTKNYRNFKNRIVKSNGRKKVLYLPTIYQGHNFRRINACAYTDNWYFRFQMQLLEFFCKQKDFDFIWKATHAGDKVKIPIAESIAKLQCSNITFENGDLSEYLGQADLALHDYPSTPLYETLLAKIPSLCVYHESLRVRPTGKALYAKVLRTFREFDDFSEHAGAFLNGDPRSFNLSMATSQKNAFEIIEEFSHRQIAPSR